MPQYIDKIGVELELAVEYVNGSYPDVNGFRCVGDGSINSTGLGDRGAREYVSRPKDFKSNWDNSEMSELESGIWKLYNKHGAAVNDSMGLHVHVSFNKEHYYQAIASERFHEHFMERVQESRLWDEYPRLQERARGQNRYAKNPSTDSIQESLNSPGSNRYRHFTFRRNTVEFRLFPALDSAKDVREAVNVITSAINSWLYNSEQEFEESDVVASESTKINDNNIQEVIEYV